ncbi:hypothetical protein [Pseudomonas fluorescens]|uniref:hypothetical protein n=1 Tax=Pseudomonas fluorescens TaxID=294 RepID=UPI00054C6EC8|nr:hypothetical protein [Pseudomonas fluorescens]
MSEVKSYHVTEAGLVEGEALGRINVVLRADFDSVTRLFLDAAERAVASERREKELQRRLTEADEREGQRAALTNDDLIAIARNAALNSVDRYNYMPCLPEEAYAWEPHYWVIEAMRAALKPAEPAKDEHVCTGCGSKGWTANCAECVPY